MKISMKRRKPLALAAFVFALASAAAFSLSCKSTFAQADDASAQTANVPQYSQGILFPYSLLDVALAGKVDDAGNINYSKLKDNKDLQEFINAISTADLTAFPTFKVDQTDPKTGKITDTIVDHSAELVFWINAYNACIINTIVENYPIKSISQIKHFDTDKIHLIAGTKYSFHDLRDKIASFDPRALLALMSGTKGGFLPAKNAYRYADINASLDAAVRVFINNPSNVQVNRLQNQVRINENFKSLDSAFQKVLPRNDKRRWSGIRYLLSAYTESGADQRYLTNSEYQLQFAPANSNLNDDMHL